jgi:hypothetical protein
MIVRELWLDILPLRGYTMKFENGVNLLRGRNGVGKTAALEAIALSGHLPLMSFDVFDSEPGLRGRTQCCAVVHYELTKNDSSFLLSNFGPSTEAVPALLSEYGCRMRQQCPETSGRFWTGEAIARVRAWVRSEIAGPQGESSSTKGPPLVVVGLVSKMGETADLSAELKHSLADEARLRSSWTCGVTDESAYLVAGLLLTVSRPEKLPARHERPSGSPSIGTTQSLWSRPFRAQALDLTDEKFPNSVNAWKEHSSGGSASLPGFVAYLNTDMYQFGIGLDIRESPKEMGGAMTEVLLNRLQLLRAERTTDGTEYCNYKLRHFSEIKEQWREIFYPAKTRGPALPDDESGEFNGCSVRRAVGSGEAIWTVNVGSNYRGFFSSGENQTFYMLALTQCNCAYGSCLLIDEPELHLSLGGASRVFDYIYDFADKFDCQIIVVTHVPFLFARRFREKKMHVMVIDENEREHPLVGGPALDSLRDTQGRNVQELFEDIRIPDDEIRVLPILLGSPNPSTARERQDEGSWWRKVGKRVMKAMQWLRKYRFGG